MAGFYLVHGTFVGTDALGIAAEILRVVPGLQQPLTQVAKLLVGRLFGDVGNYTPHHVELLNRGLDLPPGTLPVRIFSWSSRNDHIGRADGAVRLIDEISRLQLDATRRLLLWGHSHAGNVFALVTNLLAADRPTLVEFFRAARPYYRWPTGCIDIPVWERVRRLLLRRPVAAWCPQLDLVTFGTPIRYGWDSGGYARLLNVINHHPAAGLPEYLAPFPPTPEHLLEAYDGDYVQQFGIAGTNIPPGILAWRTWRADRRLGKLLEANVSPRAPLDRLQVGARVPDEGMTLLVDYGKPDVALPQHHAGHAVYTRPEWLLFHAEQTVEAFYPA